MPQIKNPGRAVVICFIVAALLASCGPVTPNPAPTPTPAKTPVPTNTPVPSATPTPAGPAVTFEKPALWNTFDPTDPNSPELIIREDQGFRLNPLWQVAKIEYVYDWWGLGEPGLGYETIKQNGSSYLWNNKKISKDQVNAFLASITNLHPVQSLLTGVFHTDDYPTWQLDLTDADGNHILLYSASNENPGYGPWHVIYDGHIYAQYEGTIGLAVGKLFDGAGGSFAWKPDFPEYHTSEVVGFETSGWPNQLSYGFAGLLPVSGNFYYKANFADSEVQGYVRGRYSIGGMGDMIVGKIDNLLSVELTVDGKKHSCNIKKVESQDAYSAEWTFSCKLESVTAGQRYAYPILVQLHTDAGQKFTTSGELYGIWQDKNAYAVLPPGEEIQAAINSNPDLQDLLKDHILYDAYYAGKMQLGKDKSPALLGEIVLDGQAKVAGYEFPYTVTIPFGIIDQKFVEWGLTRQELQRLISDVFKISLPLRVYKNLPHTTLNLWYVTKDKLDDFPTMPFFVGSSPPSYFGVNLPRCGKNPAIAFPATQQPLRAFGFMSADFRDATTFVLAGNEAIPYGMNLYPATDKDELIPYLAPKELMRNGEIPFDHIQYEHLSKPAKITYTFYLELQPHDETKDVANSIANSLPVKVDKQFGPYWSATDTGIVMNNDGSLSVVSCPIK